MIFVQDVVVNLEVGDDVCAPGSSSSADTGTEVRRSE